MSVQDITSLSDLPRLAERMEAANFAGVAKLRHVRFQGGLIYADRPDTTEEKQWWKPIEAYYAGQKPYLALARCESASGAVARFLETYGAITEEQARIASNQIRFRLSEFERERWAFAFAVELASGLKKPATLREIFLERLEEAAQDGLAGKPGWYSVIERIRWALNVPQPQETTKAYLAVLVQKLKPHLHQMSERSLAKGAAYYLTLAISERLRNVKVWFECEAGGGAGLSAQCFDNLLNSFYWMLANDLATRRAPCRCAYCERFFFSAKTNVRYCGRRMCKERGRRKVDWERNKKKYNRNRKKKRKAERKRRGEHAKAKKA